MELPTQTIDSIFADFFGKKTYLEVDLEINIFSITADERREEISFSISDFDRALINSGGWVEFADSKY